MSQVHTPLGVTVANGQKMYSHHSVYIVKWKASNVEFEEKFRMMNLRSCDMVLGGNWMREHKLVTFDYELYELWIKQESDIVILIGDT